MRFLHFICDTKVNNISMILYLSIFSLPLHYSIFNNSYRIQYIWRKTNDIWSLFEITYIFQSFEVTYELKQILLYYRYEIFSAYYHIILDN